LAFLVAVGVSEAALANEEVASSLRLDGPMEFNRTETPRISLLDPEILAAPASMESAIGATVLESLAAEATAFSDRETATMAGGGDDAGGAAIEVLAFILGVIPGFGIGHLVGGSIFGFVTWLCTDIVIGVLLFWIFPILIFPYFQYMYLISTIAVVIERIFEGYGAFRAAYWNFGYGRYRGGPPPPPPYGDNGGATPLESSPNLVSLHF
jgi:hypothetical protein